MTYVRQLQGNVNMFRLSSKAMVLLQNQTKLPYSCIYFLVQDETVSW